MKLVVIIGNGAVGKMTVGQELSKITGLRLFHNHMSIEPIIDIFGEYNADIVRKFRELVFNEFARMDKCGLIFTYIWAFDEQSDWDYMEHLREIFKDADVYYVELVAPQKIRLQRNSTENRLKHKPSKRNLQWSNKMIVESDAENRLESYDGEIPYDNYVKIDNSTLSATEVARMIKDKFGL
ncbi:MAG: AAA family ATPase [Eubacterium sp.]|nr:AAA family ATPase [Eubacterium sp.]